MSSFAPPIVDFSPLGNLVTEYQQSRQRANQLRVQEGRMGLADLAARGDWAGASQRLFAAGDLEGGMQLASLARQERESRETSDLGTNFNNELRGMRPGGAAAPAGGLGLSAIQPENGGLARLATEHGARDYFSTVRGAESGGNDAARNPTSSATGRYQFTNDTWRGLVNSNEGRQAGLTLDGRGNPQQQDAAMRLFTDANARALQAAGVAPSPGNLYMTHFLGQSGGPAFLRAMQQDPNAPATSYVGREVPGANRTIFFRPDGSQRTAGEVYAMMTRRFQNVPDLVAGETVQQPGSVTSTALAPIGGGDLARLASPPVQVASAGNVRTDGVSLPPAQIGPRGSPGGVVAPANGAPAGGGPDDARDLAYVQSGGSLQLVNADRAQRGLAPLGPPAGQPGASPGGLPPSNALRPMGPLGGSRATPPAEGQPEQTSSLPAQPAGVAPPQVSQQPGQPGQAVIPPAFQGIMNDPMRLAIYSAHPRATQGMRETARVMLENWMRANQPTDEVREYLYAVQQGEQRRFTDWSIARRQAGATRINNNVTNQAENAEATARGRGVGDRLNGIAGDMDTARQDLAITQQLNRAMSNIEPGARSSILNSVREATRGAVVLDPNADNVQAANALINYMMPRMRIPGSGATSDRDLEAFRAALPSLMGTPEGNQMILRTIGGINQMRVARGQVAQQWQTGRVNAEQAFQQLDSIPDPFEQFRAWQSQNAPARGQQQPGGAQQRQGAPNVQWRIVPQGGQAPAAAPTNIPFRIIP